MIKTSRLIIITSLCLLAGNNTSLAGERTEREMLSIAQRHLQGVSSSHKAPAQGAIEKLLERSVYNVYGSDQAGFVVVSKDDTRKEVLGYSDSKFDASQMPCGLKWWLEAADAVASGVSSPKGAPASYTVVDPLLSTKWDQGDPYNFLVPQINGTHAPTGCVATAMAQIMYFYKYPSAGTGTGYYQIGDNEGRVTEPVANTYEWDQMLDSYKGVALTDEIRTPIGKLMKDAGLASHMHYMLEGSGTHTQYAGYGFSVNFAYDSLALRCYSREYYEETEWMDMLYSELANGRPILYSGVDAATGGHAFVFDGVDANGLIHVNWGWSGEANGYFDIADLNPMVAHTVTYHFNKEQEMLFGFRCNPEPTADESYESLWYLAGDYTVSIKSRMVSFTANEFYNYHFLTFYGTLGIVIESTDGHPENDRYIAMTGLDFDAKATFWGLKTMTNSKIIDKLQPGSYRVFFASKAAQESRPTPVRSAGGAVGYTMTVDDNGTPTLSSEKQPLLPTAISPVETAKTVQSTRYYDLQGREVKNPTKGLYITNGKKVIMK